MNQAFDFSLWEITLILWEKAIAGLLQGKILTDFSKKKDILRQEGGPKSASWQGHGDSVISEVFV